jgi:hypothetical protein
MKASWNDRPYASSNSASRKTQYIETYQFGVIFDAFSFSHDHDHGCALRERRQRSRVECAVTWLFVVCHVASSELTIGRIHYRVRDEDSKLVSIPSSENLRDLRPDMRRIRPRWFTQCEKQR